MALRKTSGPSFDVDPGEAVGEPGKALLSATDLADVAALPRVPGLATHKARRTAFAGPAGSLRSGVRLVAPARKVVQEASDGSAHASVPEAVAAGPDLAEADLAGAPHQLGVRQAETVLTAHKAAAPSLKSLAGDRTATGRLEGQAGLLSRLLAARAVSAARSLARTKAAKAAQRSLARGAADILAPQSVRSSSRQAVVAPESAPVSLQPGADEPLEQCARGRVQGGAGPSHFPVHDSHERVSERLSSGRVAVADGGQPSAQMEQNAAVAQADVVTDASGSDSLPGERLPSPRAAPSSGDGVEEPNSADVEVGADSDFVAGETRSHTRGFESGLLGLAEELRLREQRLEVREQELAQRVLSDEQRLKRLEDSLGSAQGFAFSPFKGPCLKQPEVFATSSADKTVGDFLAEIERYLRLTNAAPDMYTEYASAYLAGEASRFWEATLASASTRGVALSWMDFKERLTQAFDVVDQDGAARAGLYALEMSTKHGVEDYYRKFVALLARMREKPTVPDQIYHFRKGLTPSLWKVTACDASNHMKPFTSFDLLVRCALAHGKADVPRIIGNEEGKEVDHNAAKRKRAEVHASDDNPSLYADSRQCYNCKGYGHVSTSCPSVRVAKAGQEGKGSAKLHANAVHVRERVEHSEECVCDDCDHDRITQLRQMRRSECNARKQAALRRGLATS